MRVYLMNSIKVGTDYWKTLAIFMKTGWIREKIDIFLIIIIIEVMGQRVPTKEVLPEIDKSLETMPKVEGMNSREMMKMFEENTTFPYIAIFNRIRFESIVNKLATK